MLNGNKRPMTIMLILLYNITRQIEKNVLDKYKNHLKKIPCMASSSLLLFGSIFLSEESLRDKGFFWGAVLADAFVVPNSSSSDKPNPASGSSKS